MSGTCSAKAEPTEAENVQVCNLAARLAGRAAASGNRAHFLIESERRVLLHCQKLLTQDNLPDGERQRLAAAAEEEMQPCGPA
jgi:hypothetical protein